MFYINIFNVFYNFFTNLFSNDIMYKNILVCTNYLHIFGGILMAILLKLLDILLYIYMIGSIPFAIVYTIIKYKWLSLSKNIKIDTDYEIPITQVTF